jgi:hypothetical protein
LEKDRGCVSEECHESITHHRCRLADFRGYVVAKPGGIQFPATTGPNYRERGAGWRGGRCGTPGGAEARRTARQPFVVENRGGGAGNIAAEGVYHSEPDGYTLLASPGATVSVNDFLFKNLNYDPRGFEPVSVLTQVPLALVVRPNFPASTFKDFLDYVKAHPGRLNYASNGIGTAAPDRRAVQDDHRRPDDACPIQRDQSSPQRLDRRTRRPDIHPVLGLL